jgi:UMF1 family MFS transporter
MGSTQAIGRAFMAEISPRSRESEFFGFYVLSNKIGSIFSLLLFGTIAGWTGNQRLAVLAVAPFFVVGLALVTWIDADRARRMAAGSSPDPAADVT